MIDFSGCKREKQAASPRRNQMQAQLQGLDKSASKLKCLLASPYQVGKRGEDKPPQQSGRATWSADGDQGRCRGWTFPVDHWSLESRSAVLPLAGGRSIYR